LVVVCAGIGIECWRCFFYRCLGSQSLGCTFTPTDFKQVVPYVRHTFDSRVCADLICLLKLAAKSIV
jgi:hypothetical protein